MSSFNSNSNQLSAVLNNFSEGKVEPIYFLMGDQFKEDPFILFQLRGKDRNTLLSSLVEKRLKISQERKQATNESENTSSIRDSTYQNNIITSPDQWWEFKSALDDELVVITPSPEETAGPAMAGELPLASNPQFPESQNSFIRELLSYSQVQAQKAMLNAMAINK